jgi:hypothetical protein
MSVFLSFVAWKKAPQATAIAATLRRGTWVADDVREPLSPRTFSSCYVLVEEGRTILPKVARCSVCVPNSRNPAIVVADRVLAMPNGVKLMQGQPFARLRSRAVSRLALEWPELMERLGGQGKAARRMVRYLDRGNGLAEATNVLAAIAHGVSLAKKQNRELLLLALVGYPGYP